MRLQDVLALSQRAVCWRRGPARHRNWYVLVLKSLESASCTPQWCSGGPSLYSLYWFLWPTWAPRDRCTQTLRENKRASVTVQLLRSFPAAHGKHQSGSVPYSRLWGESLLRDRTGKYGVGWLFGSLSSAILQRFVCTRWDFGVPEHCSGQSGGPCCVEALERLLEHSSFAGGLQRSLGMCLQSYQ